MNEGQDVDAGSASKRRIFAQLSRAFGTRRQLRNNVSVVEAHDRMRMLAREITPPLRFVEPERAIDIAATRLLPADRCLHFTDGLAVHGGYSDGTDPSRD
jgi:hypothetical protein